MTTSYIASLALWILVIHMNRRAWKGILKEPRWAVDGTDLIAAALFWGAAIALCGSALYFYWDIAPAWVWPILAMSASGLALFAARIVLGLPINKPIGQTLGGASSSSNLAYDVTEETNRGGRR